MNMRFARVVFSLAGLWGIAVLTPLYALVEVSGRVYTPPTDDPRLDKVGSGGRI